MLEKVIKLASMTDGHPDFDNPEYVRVQTPSYWALELAAKYGVDMTNPQDAVPAWYSVIFAALLTSSAGLDAAFNPVRAWSPNEVAARMLPEEVKNYKDVFAALIRDLNEEIRARKGDSPNPPAAATPSRAGGGKRSASRSTPKACKESDSTPSTS